jgi:hypothetical protein
MTSRTDAWAEFAGAAGYGAGFGFALWFITWSQGFKDPGLFWLMVSVGGGAAGGFIFAAVVHFQEWQRRRREGSRVNVVSINRARRK